MNHSRSSVAIAALLCLGHASAQADERPSWKFSGFGTAGAVHSSERDADFVASRSQPNGAGATSGWSAGVDSKLGGQADLRLNPQWSASAQVLARHQHDNSYQSALSLAFVKWAPGGGVEVRAGRMPYAAFVVSDYRNIGYSQPWVRPPMEVYGLSIDHVDGADATWRSSVGDVGIKAQAMAGTSKLNVPQGGSFNAKGLAGTNVTAELDALTARLSYVYIGKASLTAPGLDGAFGLVRSGAPAGAIGPGAPALSADPSAADEFEFKNKPTAYLSVGLGYDPGNWFVTGEFGRLRQAGFTPAVNEFYLTSGIRLGAYTPYVGMAQYKRSSPPLNGNPIVQAIIDGENRDQKSITLGVRWDFAKSADLKVQFDRFSNGEGSTGFLANTQAGFAAGGRYSVVSVAVDFVF